LLLFRSHFAFVDAIASVNHLTSIQTAMCVCVRMYVYTCTIYAIASVNNLPSIHHMVCVCVCMQSTIWSLICVYMYIHTYICLATHNPVAYIHIHVHTYIHTHKRASNHDSPRMQFVAFFLPNTHINVQKNPNSHTREQMYMHHTYQSTSQMPVILLYVGWRCFFPSYMNKSGLPETGSLLPRRSAHTLAPPIMTAHTCST
jgi:hypothetical protein